MHELEVHFEQVLYDYWKVDMQYVISPNRKSLHSQQKFYLHLVILTDVTLRVGFLVIASSNDLGEKQNKYFINTEVVFNMLIT